MSRVEGGKVQMVTDVKVGDELLMEYSGYGFDAPAVRFWVDFCEEQGMKDFLTGMREHEDFWNAHLCTPILWKKP